MCPRAVRQNPVTDISFSYNDSGNLATLEQSGPTLSYNQENRLTGVSGGPQYVMDAQGRRVRKTHDSVTTDYFYIGATVIAEKKGETWTDYIFFGGQRVATHEGTSLRYHHADHLSVRVTTDTAGAKIGEQGHYPFGEQWYSKDGGGNTITSGPWQFTSYERDSESLNDYAIFRTHINRLGRFNRPDPIAGSITDPQSLNRYAYVLNDPMNFVDPLGLCEIDVAVTMVCSRMNGRLVGCTVTWYVTKSGCEGGGGSPTGGGGGGIGGQGGGGRGGAPTPPGPMLPSIDPEALKKLIGKLCVGMARVLQGNPRLIGRVGGFPPTVVAPDSAAVIPTQFGISKGQLTPHISRISGSLITPTGQTSFAGVSDVIGGRSPIPGMNVRDALRQTYPDRLIVELPSAPRDFGVGVVFLRVPYEVPCPEGTRES
jgi:RHS repeat-associated protein